MQHLPFTLSEFLNMIISSHIHCTTKNLTLLFFVIERFHCVQAMFSYSSLCCWMPELAYYSAVVS